jgi:hypothetical protein
MLKNNGIRANHARNQNSKPGKAITKNIADKIAKRTFTGAGIFSLIRASSFIRGQFNKINLTEQFNHSEISRSD